MDGKPENPLRSELRIKYSPSRNFIMNNSPTTYRRNKIESVTDCRGSECSLGHSGNFELTSQTVLIYRMGGNISTYLCLEKVIKMLAKNNKYFNVCQYDYKNNGITYKTTYDLKAHKTQPHHSLYNIMAKKGKK